jgi:hypothetical protein
MMHEGEEEEEEEKEEGGLFKADAVNEEDPERGGDPVMWDDAQETDQLLTPAAHQARAGREPPTRSAVAPPRAADAGAVGCSLAHLAIGISCFGLLLSMLHLCVDIHKDALESAGESGLKRGMAAAPAWPVPDSWQTGRSVPASWVTCSDMAQSQKLKIGLNLSDSALQVSSPISYDPERERRWADIMASLRNTTARVAKMHPDAASPLDHVMRMQREHEQGIGTIAQIVQRMEQQQEQWQRAGESDGTHVEGVEDEQHSQEQHAHATKLPGPVADSNATSFRRSPELAGEGEGSDKEEETLEEILDALRYCTAKDAASALPAIAVRNVACAPHFGLPYHRCPDTGVWFERGTRV